MKEIRQTLEAISILAPEGSPPTETAPVQIPIPGQGPATATPETGIVTGPGSTPVADAERFQYFTASGDTLPALAGRFGVAPELILASSQLDPRGLLPAGTELWIPNRVGVPPFPKILLPDSEVVDSPTAAGYNLNGFIDQKGGYLSRYVENVQSEQLTGADIIQRVAVESSVNPRLLLALIELRSGWVRGLPGTKAADSKYPIGFRIGGWEGLYRELVICATHLNAGYYGWRDGSLVQLQFRDGSFARVDPRLNAGSVGVQNLLAKLYADEQFETALYGPDGFGAVYQQLFGDPWAAVAETGGIFPAGVSQPQLELPFNAGQRWSLTGGPHPSWKTGSPRGAIDLAPVTGEAACAVSTTWVTAPAAGVVVRSARNVVALDLDRDGYEQTGWVVIFMHVADRDRVGAGANLSLNDRIGHPSCEGGTSTGTHVHVARKYNGEWIAADGPLPLVLGGWQAYAGSKNYQGGMVKDGQEVVASPVGPRTSIIVR